jgi:hypothetical protein
VAIGIDCIGSCKSNYHTITARTVPLIDLLLNDVCVWFIRSGICLLSIKTPRHIQETPYYLQDLVFVLFVFLANNITSILQFLCLVFLCVYVCWGFFLGGGSNCDRFLFLGNLIKIRSPHLRRLQNNRQKIGSKCEDLCFCLLFPRFSAMQKEHNSLKNIKGKRSFIIYSKKCIMRKYMYRGIDPINYIQ